APGEGNKMMFSCPYHSWTSDLTGKLRGCPWMERTEGFDKEKNGLIPLNLEIFGCFIFINFSANPKPLSEHLGDFPEQMASYKMENMRLVRKTVDEVKCNWKAHFENAMEEYHLPTVHKETLDPKQME